VHSVHHQLMTGYLTHVQNRLILRHSLAWLLTYKRDSTRAPSWKRLRLGGILALFFVGGLSAGTGAETASPFLSSLALQSLPSPTFGLQDSDSHGGEASSTGGITGTVRDARGALLPGVRVTLVGQNDTAERAVMTDANGDFTFADLPVGTYRVKINVTGLEPFTSAPLIVGAGEKHELPPVTMRIATKSTTVDVVATLKDVARAQVKAEEKQRILGFLPNYYTSYIWNAAPMTDKLKFRLALRTATDPVTFMVVAGVAGVEQAHKTFPGYGPGFEGYAKRYGATYADTVSGRMLGSAIFPVLLHQDPRYFYQGSGSTRSRLLYALLSTVVCRGDNGQLEPNYSHILGSFTAAGLSNLYRAPQDRQASLTFRNGLIITGSGAVVNVLREFLSRKLTANVPAFANGKP
jgi:Carboxypeptidase regulatory-like domain